jgi:hypothetical protein
MILVQNQLKIEYVEIKCQLDATNDFYCRPYCLLNMFRGTTMPIISSSRVLYRWLLPVVFGALVFKLSVCCGTEGYVSGLRAAAARKHTDNLKTKAPNTTGSNHLYNSLELLNQKLNVRILYVMNNYCRL